MQTCTKTLETLLSLVLCMRSSALESTGQIDPGKASAVEDKAEYPLWLYVAQLTYSPLGTRNPYRFFVKTTRTSSP